MGVRLDHRVQEAINRGAFGVEIDIWPQHTTGRVRNYQQLFSSIPSLSKEDVMLVQNGRKIDHWVEEQGEVWGKLPELGSEHQTIIALVRQRGPPNLSDAESVFLTFRGAASAAGYVETDTISPTDIVYEANVIVSASGTTNIIFGITDHASNYPSANNKIAFQSYSDNNLRYLYTKASGTGGSISEAPDFNFGVSTRLKFTNDGSIVHGYVDGNEISTGISTNIPTAACRLVAYVAAGSFSQQWAFCRKYIDVDPIVSIRRTLSRSQLEAAVRAQI